MTVLSSCGAGNARRSSLPFGVSGSAGKLRAEFDGVLRDRHGNYLTIDGLWALEFGPGAGGFDLNELYFTAGPNDEVDGVFGKLGADSGD